MISALLALSTLAGACAVPTQVGPETAAGSRDSLHLAALYRDAAQRDPRAGQLDLLADQSRLRLRSLDAERWPALTLAAQAQYQSDVTSIPIVLPGGARPPAPPNDSYDAHLAARQRLWDPTLGPRRDVERAQLAESQSRVRTTLFALRPSIDEAFFAALAMQTQASEVEVAIAALEARRRVAAERVQGGAALPSDAAALDAELVRRRQLLAELVANRDASLEVLGELTGRSVAAGDVLVTPDLADEVSRVRAMLDEVRMRPEYERFARARDLLGRPRAVIASRDRPRVAAFARAGHGRPGLDPLAADFDTYWLAGVQLEWTPWSWGTTAREREALVLQERILASDEAAFTEALHRGIAHDLATIERLERALETDEELIALRTAILRETRLRFDEGVITSAELVDRETELLSARIASASHRIELARARARLLTLLGIEVQ